MKLSRAARSALTPVLLAFGLTGVFYLMQSNVHLNWADEGFLWYGAIHTRLGEIPIRDFQSYDPLRYYWCAALSFVFGDGIIGLRRAEWLFQAIGLSFGLMALGRALKTTPALATAAIVLILWQPSAIRNFDSCWPMLGVFFAVRLLEKPTDARHFQAGAVTGLSLWMGLNHALYFSAAFFALMLFFTLRGAAEKPLKKITTFLTGTGLGLLPTVVMMLCIPGYFAAYCERFGEFSRLLSHASMNLRSAIPWPWTLRMENYTQASPAAGLLQYWNLWAQGAAFATVILFYALAFFAVVRLKKESAPKNALLLACFFIGLPYLNHIFSRSDILHLAEAFFPVVAGICAVVAVDSWVPSTALRKTLAVWMLLVTFLGALPLTLLFFKATCPPGLMTPYRIGRDKIWIMKQQAEVIERLKTIVRKNIPGNETLFAAPIMPTLYCLLDKPSPTYQIYFWWPGSDKMQERTVRELEKNRVNWAFVTDMAIDGRDELIFSKRYALVWGYLIKNFENLPIPGLPDGYFFLRRKNIALPQGRPR